MMAAAGSRDDDSGLARIPGHVGKVPVSSGNNKRMQERAWTVVKDEDVEATEGPCPSAPSWKSRAFLGRVGESDST